ncbi:unnamed protein product, partial [Ectocarpus fasciculatus]
RRLRRGPDHGAGGPGARAQEARHVHRLHGAQGAPPPGVRGGGQRDRRGFGGLLRHGLRYPGGRRQLYGQGQRARHPVRHPPAHEEERPRDRHDRSPRRREVRRGRERVQGVGRSARRRCFGGERPEPVGGGRSSAGGKAALAFVREGKNAGRPVHG